MPITSASVVRLLIRQTYREHQILNVLHYEADGVVAGAPTLDQFNSAWTTAVETQWRACLTDEVELSYFYTQRLMADSEAAPKFYIADEEDQDTRLVKGTAIFDTLPPYCATVLSLRTGNPSRRRRGRIYMGGIPEAFQEEGVLSAAGVTAYDALATALLAPLVVGSGANTVTMALAVFSKEDAAEAGGLTPLNESSYMIRTILVDRVIYKQLRRSLGRGA